MLLVHLRRQQIRYLEVEILAFASASEETSKDTKAALERYHRFLFPGISKPKDTALEQAKKALAEEAKKVYLVRPLKGANARQALQRMATGGSEAIHKWAAHELKKEQDAETSLRQRMARRRVQLPKGAEPA